MTRLKSIVRALVEGIDEYARILTMDSDHYDTSTSAPKGRRMNQKTATALASYIREHPGAESSERMEEILAASNYNQYGKYLGPVVREIWHNDRLVLRELIY